MNITIYPGKLSGQIRAIPSKSQAHRFLICAAFADKPTFIQCPNTNQDIEATARSLSAIGAKIRYRDDGYYVEPVCSIPNQAKIDCGESGSTLRFLLPICCALGIRTIIHMSGRLPARPLSPLWEELQAHGCCLSRPTNDSILVEGKLKPGTYTVAGNVSSQYISGLLFAAALMDGKSNIHITGKLESVPYVEMTQLALRCFDIKSNDYIVTGKFPFSSPEQLCVEGDWSNAAFFLVAKAIGNPIEVIGLDLASSQGDKAIMQIISRCERKPVIDISDIPDLAPILAVYFATQNGATFTNIQRLRLKESDRVASVSKMLRTFGIDAEYSEDTLRISSGAFHAGYIDAMNDHRIAMAAAIAATVAKGPVTIYGAECVAKSYPAFWEEYRRLGGNYEQYLR